MHEIRQYPFDILVLLDADGQHNPDEIPRLIEPITEDYDLVIGSRVAQSSKTPKYRRFGQKIFLYLTRYLSNTKLTDSESGFRALSRKAVLELNLMTNGFAIETEMITKAQEKHLRLTEVEISNIYTQDGSTLNPFQHGMQVFMQIIAMISERKPLFFFGLLSSILLLAGVIAGSRVIQLFAEVKTLPMGTLILSVLLIILGAFSGFTGIILNVLSKRKD
jgi:glycosyltransferase involved in cell wall biosynthesis